MKINAKFYLINLIVISLAISCGKMINSENYFYLSEFEALDVGYPYGAIVYKSSEEYLYRDVIIGGHVLLFKKDSKYVVAKQALDIIMLRKWISESIEGFINFKGYNGEKRELKFYDYVLADTLLLKYDNTDSSVNYLTNLVLESPIIQKAKQNGINYWIIQIANDSLIGPLTKPQFEHIRNEMKIEDRLKLD
jgi:hypothetical protein